MQNSMLTFIIDSVNKLFLKQRRTFLYKYTDILSGQVAKCWVNLGVMPPLSDWEVVGSNSTAGMSKIGLGIQVRNFNVFS